MFLSDPLFYCLAIPAVLVTGISKAGFGGGLGVMAVPLLSMAVSPRQAAAIMLPLLCLTDLFGTREFWNKWDTRNLGILLPAAFAGVVAGAVSFRLFDTAKVQLLVGTIAVVFALNYWAARRSTATAPRASSVAWGRFWGAIGGFTSFVAHSGGPPVNVYLLPQRLNKQAFVATSILLFAFLNYVKIVPYVMLGLFQSETLKAALVLSPLVPFSTRLGRWLNLRVEERMFYRICYGLLFVTGLKLIYDGMSW